MNRWNYDILYPKRGGGWRVIKAGKWWINQNTPPGDEAELWEVKPYGGKKLLDIRKYKKAESPQPKEFCRQEVGCTCRGCQGFIERLG